MLPLVSIILAVKNESSRLREAISDLLDQSYNNIELILSDDASSNVETRQIIENILEARVKKIYHSTHQGQSKVRNAAIAMSTGEFIAIADADDRYHRDRIRKQVNFLLNNPAIDLCGSNFTLQNGKPGWEIYTSHNQIQAQFILNNPFLHPSIMFRRSLIEKGFEYHSAFDYTEDYELLASFRHRIRMSNLKDKLVVYNMGEKEAELKELSAGQVRLAEQVRDKIMEEDFRPLSAEMLKLHHRIARLDPGIGFKRLMDWKQALIKNYRYPGRNTLNNILSTQIVRYCALHKIKAPRLLYNNLLRVAIIPWKSKLRLGLKSLKSN